MLTTILGVGLIFFAVNEAAIVEEYPYDYVFYEHPSPDGEVAQRVRERGTQVRPVSEFQYRNVVRQQFDYSCGSAALTTILNHYLGRNFTERQVMEGLLRFGETEQIVERRGFSLLDFQRLSQALGHPSGGFRAQMEDLGELDHPAIVPIQYGGFKHFVVLREYSDGRVYVADPALGNLSFTSKKFEEIWEENVVFIVFPNGIEPRRDLELTDHDLRMLDDRTINRLVFEEFPVFTKNMEQWADKASTLQRVIWEDEDGEEEIRNIPTRTYYRPQ